MSDDKALQFPCRFPIKVMGKQSSGMEEIALALIGEHVADIAADDVQTRPSSNGRFVSVTITVTAESQQQLDAIYQSLTDHEAVLFAL
jgi:putative lipoic acid-binding regulatory protein